MLEENKSTRTDWSQYDRLQQDFKKAMELVRDGAEKIAAGLDRRKSEES